MMHTFSLEHLPNEKHSSDEQGYYFFDMKFMTQGKFLIFNFKKFFIKKRKKWKWEGKFDTEQKKLSNYYLGSSNFF